jgi:hypothetical protein
MAGAVDSLNASEQSSVRIVVKASVLVFMRGIMALRYFRV